MHTCAKNLLIALWLTMMVTVPACAGTVAGMAQWKSGMVDIVNLNQWYSVPSLTRSLVVDGTTTLWRIYANVRYRFMPANGGDYCSLRFRILVDGAVSNVVGVVFDPKSSVEMDEVNEHATIETLANLGPGTHTVSVQVLKWDPTPHSHVDIFADMNGYSTLIVQRIL